MAFLTKIIENHVKQIMLNIMTYGISNYFVIGSLSYPKDKSNHVWKYVIFIAYNVKYVNVNFVCFSQLDTPSTPGVFVFTMKWGHAFADLSLFV